MFKNSFSFNGRIRRTEYGLSIIIFYAFYFAISLILGMSFDLSNENQNSTMTLLLLLVAIPGYWFIFAQGAKRCHDRGNSGWYQIIPFYGLWMLFADSEIGKNEYGLNPKDIGNDDEIDEIGKHLSS